MPKRILLFLAVFIVTYLIFWPTPLDPVVWEVPKSPGFEGQFASNEKLKAISRVFENCHECEDVAIDAEGILYAGSVDGKIMTYDLKSGKEKLLVNTKGRPLGLHFDKDGYLIVADAGNNLISVSKDGDRMPLIGERYPAGKDLRIIDDLDIDSSETVFFSNASSKYYFDMYKYDLLEHRPNGQLFSYNLKNRELTLLVDSLYFANGVALDHQEEFVLVAETGAYRLSRYWLKGPKKGSTDIFIDNLPGFPDGISRGEDGIFWLTLASPRKASLDAVMIYPELRKVLTRLPEFLHPKPGKHATVLGLDREGRVVHNLQDPDGEFGQITNAQQFGDSLYLGSLAENGIGILPLK
ncbi:MAG: SMP-30/gluconolactonase/LRE family protein [Bacteroidia bacterium]|nr:SMP-30/gluconolactonase/LRE family protein [Bacteroidia bacterium]